MTEHSAISLDAIFVDPSTPSFADLMEQLGTNSTLTAARRKDLVSGLRRVAEALNRTPALVPADPRWLQPRLARIAPAAIGVTRPARRAGRYAATTVTSTPSTRPVTGVVTLIVSSEVDRFMPPVPPGIKHKVLRALPGRELLMLARLLESDRENLHKNVSLEKTVTVMRSIVFMRDETAIREAAHRLRNLIWNKWAMELLLPDSGASALPICPSGPTPRIA